tara:strand:+ start:536 stop:781 length:246 start_codon:yes stop_codon:yes gene_type:complete
MGNFIINSSYSVDAYFKKSRYPLSKYLSKSTHIRFYDAFSGRKYHVGIKQLGCVDVEMVIKTYGHWISDNSMPSGYHPVHD